MDPNEKTLTTFETRIRQMILRFQELKKENTALHVQLQKDEQEILNLKSKLAQADSNYNSLKMAKMLEITDGDLEGAKARVSKMIREVNKCISLLSDGK
jgi:predicted RNase H-like nuclease (RuvC/YqgF family)